MTFSGSGHGKLILFGEHAAVYGYPATGIPLSDEIRIKWNDTEGSETELKQVERIPAAEKETLEALFGLLRGQIEGFRIPFAWEITGKVHRHGGFGSSAALCTAIARAVLEITGGGYSQKAHVLANILESHFHGTPSGIDTGMAGDWNTSAWIPGDNEVPDRLKLALPDLALAFGAVTRTDNTASTVGRLRHEIEARKVSTVSAIHELGKISQDFIGFISTGIGADNSIAEHTGVLANMAQGLLSEIGLSVPDLDLILDQAQAGGALGGKMSGGGAGGAFWLIYADSESRKRGLKDLGIRMASSGVRPVLPPEPLSPG